MSPAPEEIEPRFADRVNALLREGDDVLDAAVREILPLLQAADERLQCVRDAGIPIIIELPAGVTAAFASFRVKANWLVSVSSSAHDVKRREAMKEGETA